MLNVRADIAEIDFLEIANQVLPAETDQRELVEAIQSGYEVAEREFTRSNTALIIAIARQLRGLGRSNEELIASTQHELLEAAQEFNLGDPELDCTACLAYMVDGALATRYQQEGANNVLSAATRRHRVESILHRLDIPRETADAQPPKQAATSNLGSTPTLLDPEELEAEASSTGQPEEPESLTQPSPPTTTSAPAIPRSEAGPEALVGATLNTTYLRYVGHGAEGSPTPGYYTSWAYFRDRTCMNFGRSRNDLRVREYAHQAFVSLVHDLKSQSPGNDIVQAVFIRRTGGGRYPREFGAERGWEILFNPDSLIAAYDAGLLSLCKLQGSVAIALFLYIRDLRGDTLYPH